MEKQPEISRIAKLAELADRPETLQEIGKRIVVEAIRNAAAEKAGEKNTTPMVVRRVRPGEKVPSDLLGQPGLIMSSDLVANSGWEKTWTNLGLWDRNWSENETDARIMPNPNFLNVYSRFRLRTILTPEEMDIVEKLRLVD
jgi:hypothetical protein